MDDNLVLKQRFFASLNEKQKKHFAAIEATGLGNSTKHKEREKKLKSTGNFQ